MPIYEYRRPDGTTFEILQSFSDEALTKDPVTGVRVERVLHAPALHFKGKGFYNTDYGTRNRQRENEAEKSAKEAEKSTKASESSSANGADSKSSPADAKPKADKPAPAKADSQKSAAAKE